MLFDLAPELTEDTAWQLKAPSNSGALASYPALDGRMPPCRDWSSRMVGPKPDWGGPVLSQELTLHGRMKASSYHLLLLGGRRTRSFGNVASSIDQILPKLKRRPVCPGQLTDLKIHKVSRRLRAAQGTQVRQCRVTLLAQVRPHGHVRLNCGACELIRADKHSPRLVSSHPM
jgi:hypothetical protein